MVKTEEFEVFGRVKLYCLLCCVSFTIACIAQIIFLTDFNSQLLLNTKYNNYYYNIFIQINIGLTGVGWAFGEYFLYILLITRLYSTYKDSVFKVANYVYIFLYIPLTIFLCLQIISTLLGLCIYHEQYTHITIQIYSYWTEILEHISAIIHAAISLILLFMFTSRLLKLFIMCGQNNIRDTLLLNNNIDDINNTKFNHTQETLLNLVIKHTILSSTAIISSQIFFNISLVLVDSFYHLHSHLNAYKKDATSNFIMLAIDCFVNVLCTFLSFKFKHKWYLIICSKYHTFCKWICSKYVAYKMKKEADQFQKLLSIQQQSYSASRDVTDTASSESYDIEAPLK